MIARIAGTVILSTIVFVVVSLLVGGGELEVDSEPGEGTIVVLLVPASALRRGAPEAPGRPT